MATGLPEVGLEAVIAGMPGFDAAAKSIISVYDTLEAKANNVQKATQILSTSFSGLTNPIAAITGQFVSLGQGVLSFGATAGGTALVGIAALTAGVVALGATALTETANYERMSLSITNLVARELSQGKEVEQQRTTLATLTKKESEELQKLTMNIDNEVNDRAILAARIQEQQQKIIDLTAKYGENGLVVIKERAELQGMVLDLQDLDTKVATHQGRITELNNKDGELVTTIEKVRVGQMSMGEAMEQATPKAQELLKWIQLLAIQSPFDQAGIADAFRTAMAYGFTTDQAKRLTTAEVDFAAATGKGVEATNLIALALGQMQAKGKVSGQELIQLTNAGVGVNKILKGMGFTLDDVSKGLVSSDAFIEAVITDMEIFKGAGKDQANTFSGLTASLNDLKSIGLREFFTGTFTAIKPYLAEFVGWLTQAALETNSLRNIGNVLGTYVASALKNISGLVKSFQSGGGLGLFSSLFGGQGVKLWIQINTLIQNISKSFGKMGGGLAFIVPIFSDFSKNILPLLIQGLTFVNDHFEEFKGALAGIGVILGTATFAAIVAGLFSLLTPINLIIAAAGILGAAWAGNWYGIRDTVINVINYITGLINSFQTGGLFATGEKNGFLAALGLSSDTIGQLQVIYDAIYAALGGDFTQLSSLFISWGTTLADNFMSWATNAYINIPTYLTNLVNGISNFLGTAWETIAPTLQEWVPKFWAWVSQAIGQLNTVLGGLVIALIAWATSGEGSTSIQNAGATMGKALTQAIGISASSSPEIASALGKLAQGLLTGIAGISATLIIVGSELVAGILKGILEALGVNLQPATFNQLSTMLGDMAKNIGTIAKAIGTNIIQGITDGITSMQKSLETSLTNSVMGGINSLTGYLGINSPSTLFFGFGTDTIQGMIDGVMSLAGQLGSTFTDLFSGFLGGQGTTTQVSPLGFDPATMITGILQLKTEFTNLGTFITTANTTLTLFITTLTTMGTSIASFVLLPIQNLTLLFTNLSTVILPTLMLSLQTVFLAMTTSLMTITTVDIPAFVLALSNIYLINIPLLIAAWTIGTTTIIANINLIIGSIITLTGILFGLMQDTAMVTSNMVTNLGLVASAVNKVASALDKLKEAVDKVAKAYDKMAKAAEAAYQAALKTAGVTGANLGGGNGGGNDAGFQSGVTNFTVPSGYPNDSYKVGLTSGEKVTVVPAGKVNNNSGGNTINNYYNLGVTTVSSPQQVIQQYDIMKGMA